MSIETRLREGSQAIKQATSQAEFTSKSPGQKRHRLGGPALAWLGGLAVIATFAVPAILTGAFAPPSSKAGGDPLFPVVFPHLVLNLSDTGLVDAYEIVEETSGERVGTHQIYHVDLPDGLGREILLRIQQPGTEFQPLDHYAPLAEGTETVQVDERQVTVHLVPDEAIDEGTYDQGMLQWAEAPGYEVILIPWGLDGDKALAVMEGLRTIGESEWEELGGSKDGPATTTTLIEPETPTTGAFEAPDYPKPDGP